MTAADGPERQPREITIPIHGKPIPPEVAAWLIDEALKKDSWDEPIPASLAARILDALEIDRQHRAQVGKVTLGRVQVGGDRDEEVTAIRVGVDQLLERLGTLIDLVGKIAEASVSHVDSSSVGPGGGSPGSAPIVEGVGDGPGVETPPPGAVAAHTEGGGRV